MARLMTFLAALILGSIALTSLYHVVVLKPMEIGPCQLSLSVVSLIYMGTGTFTAYLLRAGRKLKT